MKNKTFKITALLLMLIMLFSITACGKGDIRELHDKDLKEELAAPASKLNAQQLYQSITYVPEMFMGKYYLKAGTKSEDDYMANSGWQTTACGSYNGEPQEITLMPMTMNIGPNNFYHKLNNRKEHLWGEFHFKSAAGNLVSMYGAVEVKDNSILRITPVETLEYDEAADRSIYTLSDTPLDYQFRFNGTQLTLSAGGYTVELEVTALTDYYEDYGKDHQICIDGFLASDSPMLDNIEMISFLTNDRKAKYNRFYLKVINEDGERDTYKAVGYLGEDGLLTFSYTDDNGTVHSYQALYFYLDNDGIILCDGTNTYYYTCPYYSDLNAIVAEEDIEALKDLPETTIEEILEKKASLFDALSKAFAEAGIAAAVDPVSGEISIDSAVLFDVNKYNISAEGQEFLSSFWQVYTSVLSADEYTGFLETIIVEGHADPSGNYDDNMVLSENRAASVQEFCEALGGSVAPLKSVGYSSDRPIYDEAGEIDYDASRRVAFRFQIVL